MSQQNNLRSFPIAVNGLTLSGVLHLPPALPKGVVVGCHGLMADKNSPKQIQLASRCNAKGLAYLRFDHRGCGESDGIFEHDTTLGNRRSDLLAAVDTLHGFFSANIPIGLFGSSLGGSVCLSVLDEIAPFAVTTLAAPIQSDAIRMPVDSPTSLKEEMMRKQLAFNIMGKLETAHHIQILHGIEDETVPVENARTLYSLAGEPKKLMLLEGADHRISDEENQKKFLEASVAWWVRWLPL